MYRHDDTKVGDFYNIEMMLQKWAIFIIGIYGDFIYLLSDQAKLLFLIIYKNVDTYPESFSSKKHVIKELSPKNL